MTAGDADGTFEQFLAYLADDGTVQALELGVLGRQGRKVVRVHRQPRVRGVHLCPIKRQRWRK